MCVLISRNTLVRLNVKSIRGSCEVEELSGALQGISGHLDKADPTTRLKSQYPSDYKYTASWSATVTETNNHFTCFNYDGFPGERSIWFRPFPDTRAQEHKMWSSNHIQIFFKQNLTSTFKLEQNSPMYFQHIAQSALSLSSPDYISINTFDSTLQ